MFARLRKKVAGFLSGFVARYRAEFGRGMTARKQAGNSTVTTVVFIAVGAIIAAALIPVALTMLQDAYDAGVIAGWSTPILAVFGLLGILIVIAVALKIIGSVSGSET